MSGSFLFNKQPVPVNVAVTGNTVTTIVDATLKAIMVPSFEVNENAGGTQNLTVEIYDGTNSRYLSDDAGTTWKARPVTAYKGYKFTAVYPIPQGSKLRVTSSSATGDFHVIGTKLPTV